MNSDQSPTKILNNSKNHQNSSWNWNGFFRTKMNTAREMTIPSTKTRICRATELTTTVLAKQTNSGNGPTKYLTTLRVWTKTQNSM